MYPSNKLFIKVSKGGNVLYIRLIKREREEESIQINLKKSYLGNTDINRTLKKKLDKKVNKKKLWNIFDQEKVDDEGEKKMVIERNEAFKEENKEKAKEGLARLKQVARDGGNLFEVMMDIVEYCSVGQVTQALFETGGKFRRNM